MIGVTLGNGQISRVQSGVPLGNVTRSRWWLVTDDVDTVIEAANFFDPIGKKMAVGDIIDASIDMDGTPELKTYMVTAISAAYAVTVALQATT